MSSRIQIVVRLQNAAHSSLENSLTKPIARLIELLIRLVWSATLPAAAKIDRTAYFGHNALAVVIHPHASIGPECFIGSHVVIGGRAPEPGGPTIERKVVIHAGAKIIGKIVIGECSVVGANAVVLKSVPPRSLVVGVPGVVRKSDIDIERYNPLRTET